MAGTLIVEREVSRDDGGSAEAGILERVQTIAGASCRSPLATIRSAASGSGLCNRRASAVTSAESQRSISLGSVRMTGMAFGWMGATIALASVVRNPKSSCTPSIDALLGPRTPLQGVQRPAKAKSVVDRPRQSEGLCPAGPEKSEA